MYNTPAPGANAVVALWQAATGIRNDIDWGVGKITPKV